MDSKILLSEYSPNGTYFAVLEEDFGTLYLYLTHKDSMKTRSIWVRNLLPAPDTFNQEAFDKGLPVPLDTNSCDHPNGEPLPQQDKLSFLWFMECNGVAVSEGNTILAILPPWATLKKPGYAMACTQPTPAALPLEDKTNNPLYHYMLKANVFWKEWDEDEAWPVFLDMMLVRMSSSIGPYSRLYPIDNDLWPPRCIVETHYKNGCIFSTIGMSILPQPNISHEVENPHYYKRIELAFGLDYDLAKEKETFIHILHQLSETPWHDNCWLGDGHIAFIDGLPSLPSGLTFKGLLFTENPLHTPDIDLHAYYDDPVTFLWCIPITEKEIGIAKDESPSILKDLLVKHHIDWKFQDREECLPKQSSPLKKVSIKKVLSKPTVDLDRIMSTLETLVGMTLIVPVQQDTVIKTKAKKVNLNTALTYNLRMIRNTKNELALPVFSSLDLFKHSFPNKPLYVMMNGLEMMLLLLKKELDILYLNFNTSKSQPIPVKYVKRYLNKE